MEYEIGDPVLVTGIIIPTYFRKVGVRTVKRALEFLEFKEPQQCKVVGATVKLTGEFDEVYRKRFQCECTQPVWTVKFGMTNTEVFVLENDMTRCENFKTPRIAQYRGKAKSMKKVYSDYLR